ncbi:MAG: hypothetical protein J6W60_04010 [Treponema sp.]|nr:hypothetical protein [Treponema sp.]
MEGTVTPAAQVIVTLVPIVGICFGAIILFFALLWKHRENRQRIAQGSYQPVHVNLEVFSLLTGLCLTGVGVVLTILFLLIDGLSFSLLGGAVPLVVGLSLLLFYKVNPSFKHKKENETR